MICLQSAVAGGLKGKVLEFYKREVLQTYGYEHALTLENLDRVGLLKLQVRARGRQEDGGGEARSTF